LCRSVDVELFLEFGGDVGPQPLDVLVPLDGALLVDLVDVLQDLDGVDADLVVGVVECPLDQDAQDLAVVDLAFLEVELAHEFGDDLGGWVRTSRRERMILGFCLSTGTNLRLSSYLQMRRV